MISFYATASASYSYDAFNQRTAKSAYITGGSFDTETYFYYDSTGNVCYERKGNDISSGDKKYLNGVFTEGVTTGDTGDNSDGTFSFYVHNAQGDVVSKSQSLNFNYLYDEIIANHGSLDFNPQMSSTTYDAYGNVTSGTSGNVGYRGYYRDFESGLYYLKARYYDSTTRSFTQQDPAKDGSNWYGYCGGNPVKYTDPTGLAREDFAQVPSQAYFAKRWYDENGHLQSELYYDAAFTMPYGEAIEPSVITTIVDNEEVLVGADGKELHVPLGYTVNITKVSGETISQGLAKTIMGEDTWEKLNEYEIALICKYPYEAFQIKQYADIAFDYMIDFFGGDVDGSMGNSFKHAFWNALITFYMSEEWADTYTTAHEAENIDSYKIWEGFTEREHSIMDLYNNSIGRTIGRAYKNAYYGHQKTVTIWGYTQQIRRYIEMDDLADLCYHAVISGKTFYLK